MTSAIATRVIPGDFRNATRATGERCAGVGETPLGGYGRWDERATCPGCLLSQRKTVDNVMMSHYVTRIHGTPSNELTVRLPAPMSSVTAVSSRFEEVIASLDTPSEPSTVGEFVRAILALSGALAAAQARITELEQSPVPAPVNLNELEQWQADWLELNHLLAIYAVQRGWCPEFEEIITNWNRRHFQHGYLLSRRDVGADRGALNENRLSADQQRANNTSLHQRRQAALERYRATR